MAHRWAAGRPEPLCSWSRRPSRDPCAQGWVSWAFTAASMIIGGRTKPQGAAGRASASCHLVCLQVDRSSYSVSGASPGAASTRTRDGFELERARTLARASALYVGSWSLEPSRGPARLPPRAGAAPEVELLSRVACGVREAGPDGRPRGVAEVPRSFLV